MAQHSGLNCFWCSKELYQRLSSKRIENSKELAEDADVFAKLWGGPKDVTVQKNGESLRKHCDQNCQAKIGSTTGDKRVEMDTTSFKWGTKGHIDRNCCRKAQ